MLFQLLIIIVVLNVAATIALWIGVRSLGVTMAVESAKAAHSRSARPEVSPEEYKKKEAFLEFCDQLLGEAITPKHTPPVLEDSWKRYVDPQFFIDFEDFANVVNRYFDETSWRLQELPDAKFFIGSSSKYGRRYDIFHGQARLGTLQLTKISDFPVRAYINLDNVHLLSFSTVYDFLIGIAGHVCDSEARATGETFSTVRQRIDTTLTASLWEATRVSNLHHERDYGRINLTFHGSANTYFEHRTSYGLTAASREAGRDT
jgi:hypothetical protein